MVVPKTIIIKKIGIYIVMRKILRCCPLEIRVLKGAYGNCKRGLWDFISWKKILDNKPTNSPFLKIGKYALYFTFHC